MLAQRAYAPRMRGPDPRGMEFRGLERGPGAPLGELIEIFDNEASEQARRRSPRIEPEKARYACAVVANPFGMRMPLGEMPNHLAERSVLASHDRDVGNSKLFEPE